MTDSYDWRADSIASWQDWLSFNRFLIAKGVQKPIPEEMRAQLVKEWLDEQR